MLDVQNLPIGRVCDVQIFRNATPVGGARWVKPRGCSHVFMLLCGPGVGGGGGASGASLSQRGGGGGGGSGGTFRGLFPAALLPDFLMLTIGDGGVGGAADTDATPSVNPTAIYWPTTATVLLSLTSGGNGKKGTAAVGGAAGAAGAAATLTGAFAQFGFVISATGVVGTAGNATAASSNVTAGFFSGASGGAGVNTSNTVANAGDIVSAYAYFPNIIGGVGADTGGGRGNDGISIMPADLYGGLSSATPLYSTGGTGGGSSGSAGIGGNGANGGQCSGGGGGGGGVTGGAGGRGGDGLAIIVSF